MRKIIIFIISLFTASIIFSTISTPKSRKPDIVLQQTESIPEPQPKPKPKPKPKPAWSPTAIGLIVSGNKYLGANVCKSTPNAILMAMAERHAKYQASICVQGHQGFDRRCNELRQTLGNFQYAEICAESWPEQVNDSMEALGWEMFKCWRQSPGHWSVACKKHRYFGASMAKGRNGTWYACIIVADGGSEPNSNDLEQVRQKQLEEPVNVPDMPAPIKIF